MKPVSLLWTLAVLLFSPAPSLSQAAQRNMNVVPPAHKVAIEEGSVYVNGKPISEEDLPASLRTLGSDVSLTFWTFNDALIEVNGEAFVFNNGSFREADPNEKSSRNIRVVFGAEEGTSQVKLFEAPEATSGFVVRGYPADLEIMEQYIAQLRERAEEFNKLTFELKKAVPQSSDLARQIVVEAENTARLASIFPHVEYEAYLGSLQHRNRGLYEELVRERSMEMRTHKLAEAIRTAGSDRDRKAHEKELRGILTEIFELKQANRIQEIEQLERQLKELQDRLEERESLKQDIIESRLGDLLNLSRW
jgi:hypothetical protein